MKNKKIFLTLLSAIMCLSTSCSSQKEPTNEENYEDVLNYELNQYPLTVANDDLAIQIMNNIINKGAEMIKGKTYAWGEKICLLILDSVGLPVLDVDPSTLILNKLEEMEKSLKNIENTLKKALAKIDQSESTRILDAFMTNFNELKISVNPVMSGLASFVDQERKANDDKEALAKLQLEEENFYNNYVYTLRKSGNSFSERVINLAENIIKPSTNAEYNLLRCFDLSVMDTNAKLQWNSQRIQPKYEYFTYITSLLLSSLSIARFEISYNLKKETTESGQAVWKSIENSLNDSTSEAINTIQSFLAQTKQEEDNMKNGECIYHVKSNIKVSSRMAVLSLNDVNTVLSYKTTYTSYPSAGGIETGYARMALEANNNLNTILINGYNDYLNADQLTSNDFSFYQYLDTIGFWTYGNDSQTVGIWSRALTEHKGNTFTNEYDYFKTEYIDRKSNYQQQCFGTIYDKVFRKAYYESNNHLNDKYLVFLEPGAEKVYGEYNIIDFASASRGHQVMLKENNFPGSLNYEEAKSNNTLGKVDKNC